VTAAHTTVARDVRILQFCVLRILRRIGHPAQNLGSCTELRKFTKQRRKCKNFAEFC